MIKTLIEITLKPLWKWYVGILFGLFQAIVFFFPELQPILTWPVISQWLPWYWWIIIFLIIWGIGTTLEATKKIIHLSEIKSNQNSPKIKQTGNDSAAFQSERDLNININPLQKVSNTLEYNLSENDWQNLEIALKNHWNEHSGVKLQIANIIYLPFAERLITVFERAGWKTTFANTPIENQTPKFHKGLLVWGYREVFVDSMIDVFRSVGINKIEKRFDVLGFGPENPKYISAINRIRLIIGHQNY